MSKIRTVCLIGSGNVAHHLGHGLQKKGIDIVQVYSRNPKHARALSKALKTKSTSTYSRLVKADLYLLAVRDDVITTVAKHIVKAKGPEIFLAHTSGTVNSDALGKHTASYGIFYPLQSMRKDATVDLKKVPFCISASNDVLKNKLTVLAKKLSKLVYSISDEQRTQLHLAAVIVNNFSNHLYTIAEDICKDKNVPFEVLLPLIRETSQRLSLHSPRDVQTGPAIRKDQQTIERHLTMLRPDKDLMKIYNLLTQHIQKIHP